MFQAVSTRGLQPALQASPADLFVDRELPSVVALCFSEYFRGNCAQLMVLGKTGLKRQLLGNSCKKGYFMLRLNYWKRTQQHTIIYIGRIQTDFPEDEAILGVRDKLQS